MSSALWPSVIAVFGTLAGGLLGGIVQAWVSRNARREARCDTRRADAVAAVTTLAAALADHRRAMWVREDQRLSGAAQDVVAQARAASHATRSAVTAPLVTVRILAPPLAQQAQDATDATYALRDAPDPDTLAALRTRAVDATDRLIEAAGHLFGIPGSECTARSCGSTRRLSALGGAA